MSVLYAKMNSPTYCTKWDYIDMKCLSATVYPLAAYPMQSASQIHQ